MKKYIASLCSLSLLLSLTNCSTDDATGASNLDIGAAPTLTVSFPSGKSNTLIEDGSVFPFTITSSEAKPYDINITISQIGGDATLHSDYEMPTSLRLPANSTSIAGEIEILSDDVIEDTETLKIEIGGITNNSNLTPLVVDFTILNYADGDLAMEMEWESSTTLTDNSGNEIDPTDLADLRLLITDVPYTTVVHEADGAGFESNVLSGDDPDGEYYVVADFYAASEDYVRNLNLTLSLSQTGVNTGETFSFAEALNTAQTCEEAYYIMAKITKSGDSYTIEEVGQSSFETHTWSGVDGYDSYAPEGWDSKITTSTDCEGTFILGLNAEWILNVWSEEVQTEGNVYYTIDGAGNITIPSQYVFTTLYSGSLYDYTVSGTGTYDDSGEKPVMHLEYVLDQDGFDVGAYWNGEGEMDTPYFVADIVME